MTYWSQITGGALIGLGAAILLLFNGKIAGVSGIYSRALRLRWGERNWRFSFLIGLLLPAFYVYWNTSPVQTVDVRTLAIAGLLVGIGVGIGNGCTSGHGVCGIANLSPRSIIATVLFMLSAFITVFIVRHLLV